MRILPEQRGLVQDALQHLYQSSPFKGTRQCQELLSYIVTHTIAGDDLLLRERVIGMEVFGRKPDYDTGEDPVVRLRASDLRKRLAQFYQSEAGQTAQVHISIPSGSYRAIFEWHAESLGVSQAPSPEIAAREAPTAQLPNALAVDATLQRPPSQTLLGAFRWIAAAVLISAIVFMLFSWRGSRNSAINQFWGPLLADPHPTLVCMGSNAVYRLSNNFLSEYLKKTGQSHDGIEFLIQPTPGEKLDQRDLLRAGNSYVAFGDVAAASNFASFLSKRGKSFTERFPPDMSFAEVQEYSSVMIGGFNNDMALTITKDLPFVLKGSDRIEERANPQHKWRMQFYGDARESEDYALITRLVDPATGHEVVSLGGIGQYGTQAAAEFLTDSNLMRLWASAMPRGWQQKSLQIVLHVRVIDYRPIKREVITTKVF